MKCPFETKSEGNYSPEFVAKIKASEEEEKYGRTKVINTDDLWK